MAIKRIAIIGASGRGKTTWNKNFISGIPSENVLINDVKNEYGGTYFSKKDFLEKAKEARRKIILFEEATIFFKGQSVEAMIEILVRARHTNNTILMVFHSLRSVPADIFELIDVFVIFPTIERPDLVEKKYSDYPEVFEAWKALWDYEQENGLAHKYIEVIR